MTTSLGIFVKKRYFLCQNMSLFRDGSCCKVIGCVKFVNYNVSREYTCFWPSEELF